jgi:hypothetical protein
MSLKVSFALLLVASGSVALVAMLSLMGRAERRGASPGALKVTHRIAGYAFAVCLAVLVARGAGLLSVTGDKIPLRAVFHIVLALGIVVVLILKILVARFYRQLLKYAPVLGLLMFTFAFVVAVLMVGFRALTRG